MLAHISNRLDIKKKRQDRSDEDKCVKQRSEEFNQKFKKQMGLIVDRPKPGYGNTNDDNAVHRCFLNPEKRSGEITGFYVELIKKFSVLLRTLSSGHEIDCVKFENLCFKTRTLYLNLYLWYYMSVTVHKILTHNTEVLKLFILLIGLQMHEEERMR